MSEVNGHTIISSQIFYKIKTVLKVKSIKKVVFTCFLIPCLYFFLSFFFLVFLPFLGLLPQQRGDSQARGLIRAVAASLCQSHSNAGSELHLQPIPQLMAMLDP